MKDEEMAEQFAKNHTHYKVRKREGGTEYAKKVSDVTVQQAFLAGLKAGRPQWHDLRKDPKDLPKFRRNILVTCEYRSKLKKKCETFEWDYNTEMPLHAIAWCEIPTFDKE